MLELQRKLLGDRLRNHAFHQALKACIVPKKSVVLDVGSGTGFLSFLAETLGAKECWLVESGDVGLLAEKLAQTNGMKRCHFVHGHSADIPLPKADIIVSETLGNYALEEGIIDTMNDARSYLKKGGVLIPSAVRQFVCPVTSPRLQRSIDVWNVGFDLDMGEARTISLQNMYVKTVKKSDLLEKGNAAHAWDTLNFMKQNSNERGTTLEWNMSKNFTIYGLALWWEATLAPGITLSTSPHGKPTHWEQIYLPLLRPVRCNAGTSLRVMLQSDTSPDVRIRLRWTVSVWERETETSTQHADTQEGFM